MAKSNITTEFLGIRLFVILSFSPLLLFWRDLLPLDRPTMRYITISVAIIFGIAQLFVIALFFLGIYFNILPPWSFSFFLKTLIVWILTIVCLYFLSRYVSNLKKKIIYSTSAVLVGLYLFFRIAHPFDYYLSVTFLLPFVELHNFELKDQKYGCPCQKDQLVSKPSSQDYFQLPTTTSKKNTIRQPIYFIENKESIVTGYSIGLSDDMEARSQIIFGWDSEDLSVSVFRPIIYEDIMMLLKEATNPSFLKSDSLKGFFLNESTSSLEENMTEFDLSRLILSSSYKEIENTTRFSDFAFSVILCSLKYLNQHKPELSGAFEGEHIKGFIGYEGNAEGGRARAYIYSPSGDSIFEVLITTHKPASISNIKDAILEILSTIKKVNHPVTKDVGRLRKD